MIRNGKKIIIIILGVILCFCCCGCGAGVDVYESSDADNWYFDVRVKVDLTLEQALEKDAVLSPDLKTKWNIKEWLKNYFAYMGLERGMSVKYRESIKVSGANNYIFDLKVPRNDKNADFELNAKYTSDTNLFMRTYNFTQESRFNCFTKQYNDLTARIKSDELLVTDYSSEVGVVLLGKRKYFPAKGIDSADETYIYDEKQKCCYILLLPAFDEAFPLAKSFGDYGAFTLDNYWLESKNIKVDAKDKIVQGKNAFYHFSKTLADEPSQIEYKKFRANGTGWYMVSILAGAITVGIIYLFCRIKKKKPDEPSPSEPFDPFS